MSTFHRHEFRDPPVYLWPGYFWVLNDKVNERKLRIQLRDMRTHGAKSVCLLPEPREFRPHSLATRLDLAYLKKPYFRLIAKLVAECRRLGMNYWLYDEGGWPSGGACGQVCARQPRAFAGQVMVNSEQGPRVQTLSYGCVPYPNLLNRKASETFIHLTHEGYKPHLKQHFGKTIRFTFTDEPMAFPTQPGQLTWTDDMEAVFRKRKGYEIRPFLPHLLLAPRDDEPVRITRARIDFYDIWSRLFVERYLFPVRNWCHANGLLSAGHLGGEDEPGNNSVHGYGHILRALRGLDIPGIDAIWRQLFPGIRSHQFPKYASSVARQKGQPLVMTESFAVYGNGLTPAQAKWVTDQQYVRGATMIVLGCYPYSSRDHFMAGERTHFGPHDPFWKYSDIYHAYTARIGYLLTRGRAVCTTAVYFDIRSIWAGASTRQQAIDAHDRIAETLLAAHCDFDYIDDDTLAAGPIQAGTLQVGRMRYDTIVMPPTRWMEPGAAKKLAQFKRAGGVVLTIDEIPARVEPVIRLGDGFEAIRACKRAWQGGALYFFTNEGDRTMRLSPAFKERGLPVLADPETGVLFQLPARRTAVGTVVDLEVAPWGSAAILFGIPADESLTTFVPGKKRLNLKRGWTLRPLCRHRVGDRDFERTRLPGVAPMPVKLGDWARHLGRSFSGDAEYAIAFDNPHHGSARLTLGKVNYACRVVLNGKVLARRIWEPFTVDLTGALRKGHNMLRVMVTNSLANALADPQVYSTWAARQGKTWPAQAFQYDRIARPFEKESLPSGLFGPVNIAFGGTDKTQGDDHVTDCRFLRHEDDAAGDRRQSVRRLQPSECRTGPGHAGVLHCRTNQGNVGQGRGRGHQHDGDQQRNSACPAGRAGVPVRRRRAAMDRAG